MTRPALVALLALPLWPGAAAGAEVTLAPGAPLTPDLVAGMVRDDLAGRGLDGDLEVEVRRPGAPVPNQAAGAMRVRLVGLRHDRQTGRFQATLEATLPTGETAEIPASGRVDELVEVTVPNRAIARGETLRDEDVGVARLPAAAVPSDGLRGRGALIGRQAVRPLAAGRIARGHEVAAPWQVRRGEEASVAFRRGGLQIVAAAVALEHGRLGESVRLRNGASGEVRRGLVVGPRRVEIAGGPP